MDFDISNFFFAAQARRPRERDVRERQVVDLDLPEVEVVRRVRDLHLLDPSGDADRGRVPRMRANPVRACDSQS